MAAPSYTEDLSDIATGDEASGWVELTGTDQDSEVYNVQGAPAYQDGEYPYIQGSYAVTQDTTKNTGIGSLAYNSGGITVPTDGAVFVWHNYSSPFAFGTYAQGGFRIVLGSGLSDFNVWYTGGQDRDSYPYGGFVNHVVNPTITRDNWAGTTTGTINYVGSAVYVLTGPGKGEPHQVDVMRYGRGSAIFELGDDVGGGYATIAGFATQNDDQNNRWGLIQATPGGYLWKGRMQLGSVSNPVYFVDTNKAIFIQWTPKVTANFNLIEIINIDSYVSMVGFTFQVLDTSTASRGRFLMSSPATVYMDSCTFIDMDTFIFDSTADFHPVEIISCIFRRCNQVTQGGAEFDGCLFTNSDAAVSLLVENLNLITNCDFISDGSNHAMELDSNHAGGSFTLLNCNYTNYAESDGSSGNECIYNNSGGHVTINVSGGEIPTIKNETGSTTSVVASIIWTFVIKNQANETVTGAEFRVYNSGTQTQVYGVESSATGTEVYNFDQSLAGNAVDVVVLDVPDYLYFRQTLLRPSGNQSTTLVLAVDRWYSNEITTKTRTWGGRPNDDFTGVVDTYIDNQNPATPYGNSVDLKLASDISGIQEILFRPNITTIPFGATINSANLYLYIYSNTYLITRSLTAYPLKRNWVESEATWNVYSTGNSWQSAGAGGANDRGTADAPTTSITNGQTGWISLDVSDSLQDYFDEVISVHYGWLLIHGGGGSGEVVLIHSREYTVDTSLRPYLEINYTT